MNTGGYSGHVFLQIFCLKMSQEPLPRSPRATRDPSDEPKHLKPQMQI